MGPAAPVNFLGADVRGLDLEAFFRAFRIVYLAAYLAWLAMIVRRRPRGAWGPLLLTLLVWAATNFPLLRVYGLRDPSDRLRHLWWAATAAAGNAPWESGVVGQRTIEPVWSLLVSLLALRDPARVLSVYPFLPVLGIAGTAAALAWAFRARPQRAMLVVFFVLLASTQPLDYLEPFRNFWARHFLLKPNHALGMALVPVLVGVLSRPVTASRTAWAAGLLGLLGWVFVVEWALLCGSLVCFLVLIAARRTTPPARAEAARLAVVLAASAAIVAPYVAYLAHYFPNAVSLSAGNDPTAPLSSPWGDERPVGHSLLFLATFDLGPHFPLAVYGAWAAWRRGRRADLLWLGVLAGAYVAWTATAILYASNRARAADEVYFFVAFAAAVHAGLGAADIVTRAAAAIRVSNGPGWLRARQVAAAFLLAWLPFTLGYWWDPPRMDPHFALSLEELPADVQALGAWLRSETQGSDLVRADPGIAPWVPALSGRRIVPVAAPADPVQPPAATVVVHDGSTPVEEADLARAAKVFRAGRITAYALRP